MCYGKTNIRSLPLPTQLPRHNGKITVVLDMDETLLHSVFMKEIEAAVKNQTKNKREVRRRTKDLFNKFKKTADLILKANNGDIAIYFRPGLRRFLFKLSNICEVVLWTAGERQYAEPILDYIDPEGKLLPYRLFREHCVKWKNFKCVKDLRLLGRNMQRTVLIDNSRKTLDMFPNNCYVIEDFYGDPKDPFLQATWQFISGLTDFLDIRPWLQNISKPSRRMRTCKR